MEGWIKSFLKMATGDVSSMEPVHNCLSAKEVEEEVAARLAVTGSKMDIGLSSTQEQSCLSRFFFLFFSLTFSASL